MEDDLEGTIRIENYFHQEAGEEAPSEQSHENIHENNGTEDAGMKEGGSGFEPQGLGSLAVVDSLTAGDESWPPGK